MRSYGLVLLAVVVASEAGYGKSESEDPRANDYSYICGHYRDGCLQFTFDEELGDFVAVKENSVSAKTLLLIEDQFKIFAENADGSATLLPVGRELIKELIGSPPKFFDFTALANRMPELSRGDALVNDKELNSKPAEQDVVETVELDSLPPSSSVDPLQLKGSILMPQTRTANSHFSSRPLAKSSSPSAPRDARISDFENEFNFELSIFEGLRSLKPDPARLTPYVKNYSKSKVLRKAISAITREKPTTPVKLYGNMILGEMFEYNKNTCVAVCERLGQFLPHLTDCGAYYHCTTDGPVVKRCGAGTAWAPLINTCDYAEKAINDYCNMHDSCPEDP